MKKKLWVRYVAGGNQQEFGGFAGQYVGIDKIGVFGDHDGGVRVRKGGNFAVGF